MRDLHELIDTLSKDVLTRLDRGEPVTLVLTRENGRSELLAVDADQAWFWTAEHQAREADADADYAAGAGITYTDEEFIAHLDSLAHS